MKKNERRIFLADSHILSIMEKYIDDDEDYDEEKEDYKFEAESDELYFYK